MTNDPPPGLPRRYPLPAPDIEVWLMPLGGAEHRVDECSSFLSHDERARAAHFHFARDRRRYTVARGILRVLLGKALGVTPASVIFSYGQHGKPYIAGAATPIHFNVSHAADMALYAISRSCVPGVDIEHLNRDIDTAAFVRRFFTPRECAELQKLPPVDRQRALLAAWTRKEAIVKSTGEGLQLSLDQIEVTMTPDAPPELLTFVPGRTTDWTLYPVHAGHDYVATVAAYRPSAAKNNAAPA